MLDFSGAEVADMLDTTPTAVKGLLQRARASLRGTHTDQTRAPIPPAQSALVRRFADAYSADDVEAVLELLTDDAWPGRVSSYLVGSRACASRLAALRSLEVGPATTSLPRLARSGAQTRSLIDAA